MSVRRDRAPHGVGMALLALAMSMACTPTHDASNPPTTPPAAASEPSPFDGLNLGFEQADTLEGWTVPSRSHYATSIDETTAFEGTRSLKLVHDGLHESGRVTMKIPADPARGKLLRARVQVRTEGVDMGSVAAGLSARRGIDTLARAQTPEPRQVRGDQDWTAIAVEVVVPPEAEELVITLDHAGSGTAWFDAVQLELEPADAPPPPARLTGRVLDPKGAPVADAIVVTFQPSGEHDDVQTDADGRFTLEMPAGPTEVGAGGSAGVATTQAVTLQPGDNDPLTLTLSPGSQRIHGRVTDQDGKPYAGALAIVGTDDGQAFPTRTGEDGTWSVEVPEAKQYIALVEDAGGQRAMAMIEDPSAEIASTLAREAVAPPAALEWISDHHVPLTTVEAGHGFEDLAALDSTFAKATVVGLGEATHGTREFFQLKHRMLEYLVQEHGFTVFGIEANRTECRAIDHYVQTGEGDPKEALDGIYFWTWNTEEVLALIEWMRQYNETHEQKLHFVGFDAQTPTVAARNVDAFLERVDPKAPQREAVAMLGRPWNHQTYLALPDAERTAVGEALAELADRFERERKAWATLTSPEAVTHAIEDLQVVRQAQSIRDAEGMASFAARDRAQADNVLAIEERFGKGTKAVLWAHNGHIARSWTASDTMGKYLGEALGKRYVSVGFTFDHGGFQAIAIEGEQWSGLREHVVGPAGDGDIEAALREGGSELFALDLRRLPAKGKAAQWLRSPLPMRQIGAGFAKDDMSCRVVESVPDKYDVLMFVEQTSRARPVRRD